MASRGGLRAQGSDGNDFRHRETVASHYQVSSTYKVRLKFAIFLHFLLLFFMLAKLLPEMLKAVGVDIAKLYNINFPTPLIWEWLWPISIIFAILAYIGIRKNKVTTMKLSAWGIFIFGIFPIVGAAIVHLEDLLAYMQSSTDEGHIQMFKGIPVAAIWYCFIGIAFQVHMLSIIFAIKLVEAWSPKNLKKQN